MRLMMENGCCVIVKEIKSMSKKYALSVGNQTITYFTYQWQAIRRYNKKFKGQPAKILMKRSTESVLTTVRVLP